MHSHFIAALFIAAKIGKQFRHSSMDKRVMKIYIWWNIIQA